MKPAASNCCRPHSSDGPVVGFGRKWFTSAEDLLRLCNQRLRKHPAKVAEEVT